VTFAVALLAAHAAWASVDFDAQVKEGLAALQRGDAARAEIALRKAVAVNPDSADAHMALALALTENHERPQALAQYKRALQLERDYVEGRKLGAAARKRGWIRRPPESWDLEQQDLALEVFNEPKAHEQEALAIDIHFPPDWRAEVSQARPDLIGSHASIVVSGGRDAFNAQDAAEWFERARAAAPERYKGYRELDLKGFARGGATGVKVLYTRRHPRFKEPLEALDVVLLKGGEYRRAVYEAPKSEFPVHLAAAEASLNTLQF